MNIYDKIIFLNHFAENIDTSTIETFNKRYFNNTLDLIEKNQLNAKKTNTLKDFYEYIDDILTSIECLLIGEVEKNIDLLVEKEINDSIRLMVIANNTITIDFSEIKDYHKLIYFFNYNKLYIRANNFILIEITDIKHLKTFDNWYNKLLLVYMYRLYIDKTLTKHYNLNLDNLDDILAILQTV